MADISKCTVKDCPLEKTCYRKTAKSSSFQSYSDFGEYFNREYGKCDMYYAPPD